MRHKSNNKTRPLFTLSLEMTMLVMTYSDFKESLIIAIYGVHH